ncbi:Plant regulator RWP-RK family protein [Rhynchospora pubera]|uniref:Plant regulator RWP-RK family protein n=1 Tax=Rhynchospora pubera TaxID=906938 RepID=A0AAV8H4Z6_9POAL|nr:Plant regulator RWP-RK family protein [Rhynchospora pubera]
MEARMFKEENEKIAQYNIKGESTVINKQNLNGLWDEIIMDASMLKEENEKITQYNIKEESMVINKQNHNRVREEQVLTLEEVSQYFYMPIIQAAKELNVGLTLLKKKCRELGIPRWPHRKMKSMQKLINNVQELGGKEGTAGDMMRSAIVKLEKEQKLMEMKPSEQMKEDTRRLRQACFKANYKKRKQLVALLGNERPADC